MEGGQEVLRSVFWGSGVVRIPIWNPTGHHDAETLASVLADGTEDIISDPAVGSPTDVAFSCLKNQLPHQKKKVSFRTSVGPRSAHSDGVNSSLFFFQIFFFQLRL